MLKIKGINKKKLKNSIFFGNTISLTIILFVKNNIKYQKKLKLLSFKSNGKIDKEIIDFDICPSSKKHVAI